MFQSTFLTKKRAPFVYPCERCLHIGFTRTYRLKKCFINEIILYSIMNIIFYAAAYLYDKDNMYIRASISFMALISTILGIKAIKDQLDSSFCPRNNVNHYCTNCGMPIARYKDPASCKYCCCFGLDQYLKRYTVVEDDYEDTGLIF